jgi:ABC-type Mn2+/Zn2+ transport system ATPase subunit
VLEDVTLHIGPADRIGILGPNGAGKSTLLALITGDLAPSAGRVKRGKTVTVRQVSQRLEGLQEHLGARVSDVVGRYRSTFRAGKDEVTPGQLLERLGFTTAHQKVLVGALSGGQQRRLDLLLTLLEEPNVLVLDEPTNDMDTDMLAAMEDLLDTWPGPLLVVSHDRYLLERVTDTQYAVLDGAVRHVPGGVEQYLELRAASEASTGSGAGAAGAAAPAGSSGSSASTAASSAPALSGAEAHAAQKELGALERRMQKLEKQTSSLHATLAEHDQTDYAGLQEITGRLREVELENEELEERWLELSEQLG